MAPPPPPRLPPREEGEGRVPAPEAPSTSARVRARSGTPKDRRRGIAARPGSPLVRYCAGVRAGGGDQPEGEPGAGVEPEADEDRDEAALLDAEGGGDEERRGAKGGRTGLDEDGRGERDRRAEELEGEPA